MKFLPEPVKFVLYFTSQVIVVGGFSRLEQSSSLVTKHSVGVPDLGGVTLYSLPVSQVSLELLVAKFGRCTKFGTPLRLLPSIHHYCVSLWTFNKLSM